jgi:hypothetical protein
VFQMIGETPSISQASVESVGCKPKCVRNAPNVYIGLDKIPAGPALLVSVTAVPWHTGFGVADMEEVRLYVTIGETSGSKS